MRPVPSIGEVSVSDSISVSSDDDVSSSQAYQSIRSTPKAARGRPSKTPTAQPASAQRGRPTKTPTAQPASARRGRPPLQPPTAELSRGRGRPRNDATGAQRRKQRHPMRQNMRVLKDIQKLRSSVHMLIPKLPFSRVVREAMESFSIEVNRVTPEALAALQESTEMYLVNFFEDAYLLTLHRQRVTLSKQDLKLLEILRRIL